jgi:hypothetical protein
VRANNQGCQMGYFQTNNTNLGKFWRVLQWKKLLYFIAIGSIFHPIGYLMDIWYIFPCFGMIYINIWQPWRASVSKQKQVYLYSQKKLKTN